MKNYDELVAKTLEKIFIEYIKYSQGEIDINKFLLRRFNIVFEEAFLNNRDDIDFNPYQFLTKLQFDLFRESEILHEIGYF